MASESWVAGSELIHELAIPLKESIALLLDLGNVALIYGCDQYLKDINSRLTHALDIQEKLTALVDAPQTKAEV